MMTPCQLSTFSEFICSAFQFQGLIARKISKCMKNNKWSQKGLKSMMWLWMVHFEHRKTRSSNKFKKMKSLCNRWIFIRNSDTSREIVRVVHEVHPVFAVTLSTFLHMLCGWNDDIMPTFNLFRVRLKCFSILGSYSSK